MLCYVSVLHYVYVSIPPGKLVVSSLTYQGVSKLSSKDSSKQQYERVYKSANGSQVSELVDKNWILWLNRYVEYEVAFCHSSIYMHDCWVCVFAVGGIESLLLCVCQRICKTIHFFVWHELRVLDCIQSLNVLWFEYLYIHTVLMCLTLCLLWVWLDIQPLL